MLASLTQGSASTMAILAGCFILVLTFEFSNGFHDTASAVATVIYSNSLRPAVAVIWSGVMNFVGVIVGGIAVAYALVELIPPDVLSPPDGSLAAGMLVSVFLAALFWNVGTCWLGIPNSSSHALIGSLIGVALGTALTRDSNVDAVDLGASVERPRIAADLTRARVRDGSRSIRSCAKKSFTSRHTRCCAGLVDARAVGVDVIGLMPATYAPNQGMSKDQISRSAELMESAAALIDRSGETKGQGAHAARTIADRLSKTLAMPEIPAEQRPAFRNDVNQVLAFLHRIEESNAASEQDRKSAKGLRGDVQRTVQYAPWWVRFLSGLCLGLGTMIGYRRIVKTLGERLGKTPLVPAQGAAAELVAACLNRTVAHWGGEALRRHGWPKACLVRRLARWWRRCSADSVPSPIPTISGCCAPPASARATRR